MSSFNHQQVKRWWFSLFLLSVKSDFRRLCSGGFLNSVDLKIVYTFSNMLFRSSLVLNEFAYSGHNVFWSHKGFRLCLNVIWSQISSHILVLVHLRPVYKFSSRCFLISNEFINCAVKFKKNYLGWIYKLKSCTLNILYEVMLISVEFINSVYDLRRVSEFTSIWHYLILTVFLMWSDLRKAHLRSVYKLRLWCSLKCLNSACDVIWSVWCQMSSAHEEGLTTAVRF